MRGHDNVTQIGYAVLLALLIINATTQLFPTLSAYLPAELFAVPNIRSASSITLAPLADIDMSSSTDFEDAGIVLSDLLIFFEQDTIFLSDGLLLPLTS